LPVPIKGANRYVPGLDGLRGIAVLSVMVYHLNINRAPGGLLGVVIFFVLSGYLITDLILEEWKRSRFLNLKNFWIRRVQRLLPALLVMLIFIMTWITLFQHSLIPYIRGDVIASLFYISNWWFIFHKVSYFESFETPSPVTHLWSLAVEEQFYIVWPLLLTLGIRKLNQRSTLVWLTISAAIGSAFLMGGLYHPGTDPSRVYYGTDTRVFSLMLGSCLAMIWPAKRLSNKSPKAAIIILDLLGSVSLLFLLVMIGTINQYHSFLYRGGMFLASIASVILVASIVHPASNLSKILGFKPLRWIGVRSYGLYLWQYPIIILSSPSVTSDKVDFLRATWQICLILLISALSWRFIENPIRSLGIINIWRKMKSGEVSLKRMSLYQNIIFGCLILMILVSSMGLAFTKTDHSKSSSSHLNSIKVNQDNNMRKISNQETKNDLAKASSRITAIGDSVMVEVAPFLEKEFPDMVVDAKVGRQMSDADSVIERLKSEGTLGNIVIIELGTNGAFTRNQLFSLITSIGNQRNIILVNARVSRPWELEVNSLLEEAANTCPNVSLVNWHDKSIGNPSYFSPDGVHPNQIGAQTYASLIVNAVRLNGN
jgi:peptidoglycan/LPS O-acetylase OafA/YrhL